MGGLLDGLFTGGGGSGGGLLDFLRNNAMNQQFSSGLESDQAQYGAPMGALAQMPMGANSPSPTPQQQPQPAIQQAPQPMQQPQPTQQPQPSQQPAFLGGQPQGGGSVMAGLNNLNSGSNPITMLANVIDGFSTGQRHDRTGIALQEKATARQVAKEQANQTAAYFRRLGVPEDGIVSAVGDGRIPGNHEVLKTLLAKYSNQEKVRPATAEERAAFGAPADLPMAMDTTTNKPIYGPAGQKTNVSLSTVANPVLKGVGDQIVAQRETAQTAARQTIPFVHQARQALDEGAITGQFADQKIFAQKVAGLFGLPTESASNSEVFRASIGNQVLASIKALGANPSNTDRDYIEKIQGGQIALEEKSMRKLLDMTEKYARSSIQNFNLDAGKLIAGNPENYKDIAPLMKFDEPPSYSFKPPAATAPAHAAPSGGGWQNLGNGVKIRPR